MVVENWGNPAKVYVELILRELAKEIWVTVPEKLHGPVEQHRVTLFRAAPRHWTFRLCRRMAKKVVSRGVAKKIGSRIPCHTHWLVPCARVPRSSRSPERVFKAHDHYEEQCEGVAGLIYFYGRLATKQLPDLHARPVSLKDIEEYAKLTNDSVNVVKHELYYARRIAGVTIYVDGRKWGILVLDSSDPEAIEDNHLEGQAMSRTLSVLTTALEEGLS
jgi:hypothetical protein